VVHAGADSSNHGGGKRLISHALGTCKPPTTCSPYYKETQGFLDCSIPFEMYRIVNDFAFY
jgi:hypothetical protein